MPLDRRPPSRTANFMSHLWSLRTGAQPQADNSVRFTVWAPRRIGAARARAHGRGARRLPARCLAMKATGFVTADVPNARAGDDYVFVLDDGRELPDPVSRWQPHGVHGPSRVVDPTFDVDRRRVARRRDATSSSSTSCTSARSRPRARSRRSFRASPSCARSASPRSSSCRSRSFPASATGGTTASACTRRSTATAARPSSRRSSTPRTRRDSRVFLDVVYNHVGPEGNYLDEFGPYFTDEYSTPWGAALNYRRRATPTRCGASSSTTRSTGCAEFHVDGLRLDAVHGIFDFSATHLSRGDRATPCTTRRRGSADRCVVIGESDLNDPRSPAPDRPARLRTRRAVERRLPSRRARARSPASASATTPTSAPVSTDRRRAARAVRLRRALLRATAAAGTARPSTGVPREPLRRRASRTTIRSATGRRAIGSPRCSSPRQLRLAAALLLLSPYVPLLFMGEEYGETNPFQYFVSHEDPDWRRGARRPNAGVRRVRLGRRRSRSVRHGNVSSDRS